MSHTHSAAAKDQKLAWLQPLNERFGSLGLSSDLLAKVFDPEIRGRVREIIRSAPTAPDPDLQINYDALAPITAGETYKIVGWLNANRMLLDAAVAKIAADCPDFHTVAGRRRLRERFVRALKNGAELGLAPLEIELLKECSDNVALAQTALVRTNLTMVFELATRRTRYKDVDMRRERIGAANLSLTREVERLEQRRGNPSTLLFLAIKQGISCGAHLPAHLIDRGKHLRLKFAQLEQARGRFRSRGEQRPSERQLADELHWTERDVRTVITGELRTSSLDAPLNTGAGEELRVADLVPDSEQASPAEIISTADVFRHVLRVLSNVATPLERTVIGLHYGIGTTPEVAQILRENDGKTLTLKEIGKRWDKSHGWAWKIEQQFLSRFDCLK